MVKKIPPSGIYVPTLAFFKGEFNGDPDLETTTAHVKRLAASGIHGIVVHGTTGEPVHLCPGEWKSVITTTKAALEGSNVTLVVGTGAPSLWETVQRCKDAAELGADYALVVAPGTYARALDDDALFDFFKTVAESSTIPVILYNFPGISNGIDLSQNLITRLAVLPNIVGIKLSCGNVAKGARLSALIPSNEFAVYGGLADTFLHGVLASGGCGVVSGLANIAPKSAVRVWEAFQRGDLETAKKEQGKLSLAGELELLGGVPGMRYGVVHYYGYGGTSRAPLTEASATLKKNMVKWLDPIMDGEEGILAAEKRPVL